MMTNGILLLATVAVIVLAGARLARYGDVLGVQLGLGRSWIGVVLLAATTSLPELFTGVGSTALADLPDIAAGDIFGSCMFNLLILSLMDALQPESISARAHQSHALAIGFGVLLVGVAGLGLLIEANLPPLGWIGWSTPWLIGLYFVAMRVLYAQERRRRLEQARQEVVQELPGGATTLRAAATRYAVAAAAVVGAALALPHLAAEFAASTGLGETFVGSLFVALTTSLPEIVVSLAAVRLGALDLAIGNVLGSNLFNLLVLGIDDLLYRPGPLLAAVDPAFGVAVLAVVTMNALFLIGLTYGVLRKRFPVAWDTGAMAAVYALAIVLLARFAR